MRARTQPANAIVGYALSGGDAHLASRTVFDGLEWRFAGARVEGSPHTLYELLNHMIFWQDGVLEWLKGRAPQMPEHAADSWPGPSTARSRAEWAAAVRRYQGGLTRLARAARQASSEGRVHRLRQQQMPLGLMADQTYEAASVPVEPGDVLAMYTDGLNETENSSGEQLGHDAIERTLTRTAGGSLPEAREAILNVARRHGPQTDDQTVLLVRIKASSSTAQPAFAAGAAGESSHRRG